MPMPIPMYDRAMGQHSNFGRSNIGNFGTIAIVPMFAWPKFEGYPTAHSYFEIQTLVAVGQQGMFFKAAVPPMIAQDYLLPSKQGAMIG